MEKYIPKAALVAKIEKCYNNCLKRAEIIGSEYWNAKADAYRNVLTIIEDLVRFQKGQRIRNKDTRLTYNSGCPFSFL